MRTHNSRLRQAMNERDKGFTLIELLVVVIIIGILAAVAIPVFLNQRKKAVDSGLKSDLKNAALQVETWITDNPQADPAANAAAALAGFTASPQNTVVLGPGTGGTGTYQICAFNPNADAAINSGVAMYYDSNAGGLQDYNTVGSVDCSGW